MTGKFNCKLKTSVNNNKRLSKVNEYQTPTLKNINGLNTQMNGNSFNN